MKGLSGRHTLQITKVTTAPWNLNYLLVQLVTLLSASFAVVDMCGVDIYIDRNGSECVLETLSSASTQTFLEYTSFVGCWHPKMTEI